MRDERLSSSILRKTTSEFPSGTQKSYLLRIELDELLSLIQSASLSFTHENNRNVEAERCCVKCLMEVKLRSTSYNIIHHDVTCWPNKFNVLHSTILNDVGWLSCIPLARASIAFSALAEIFSCDYMAFFSPDSSNRAETFFM